MKSLDYLTPKKRSWVTFTLSKSYLIKRLQKISFIFIPLFLIVLMSYGLYLLIYRSSIFNLDKSNLQIYGTGTFVDEKKFSEDISYLVLNKNILNVNIQNLESEILKKYPSLKEVKIKKNIPPHMTITVVERVPSFAIYKDTIDDCFLVDSEGFVLSKMHEKYKEIFKIQYINDVKAGDYIDSNISKMYKDILVGTDKYNFTIEKIIFDKDYSYVYLSNKVTIVMLNKKGVQDTFNIVSSILDKLNTETKKVSKIDLRYDKLIVSYE